MSISYVIYCLAVVVTLFLCFCIIAYNRMILLKQRHIAAFSQIDVQLKRRYDLIPGLVQAVKGYMQHERQIIDALTQARETALQSLRMACSPSDIEELQNVSGAELQITHSLAAVLGRVEAYPELKASLNSSELMEELRSTENRIAFARQHYNDAAAKYNTYRESFPVNMLATIFGFYKAGMLEFEDTVFKNSPQISL